MPRAQKPYRQVRSPHSGLGKPAILDLVNIATQLTSLRRFLQTDLRLKKDTRLAVAELRSLGFTAMLERLDKHIESTYEGLKGDASRREFERTQAPSTRHALGSFQRSVNTQKLDWANEEHKRTLDILSKALDGIGCIAEFNLFIDVFTRLKSGPAIFEVKSITEAKH